MNSRVVAVCAGVGVLALLLVALFYTPRPDGAALAEIEQLNSKVIVDFTQQPDGTVLYQYLGAAVPVHIEQNEVPELRTPNSYTKFIEVAEPGPDPLLRLQTVFYPQDQFAESATGEWHQVEYATTTQGAWDARLRPLAERLQELFVATAHAVTDTIYSEAGDGYVSAIASLWSTVHDATTGTASPTAATSDVGGVVTRAEVTCGDDPFPPPIYNNSFSIMRLFLPFDTSSISASATVSAATLNVYVTAKVNTDNDGTDYIGVIRTSQATHTTLANGDYDNAGAVDNPTQGASNVDIGSISASAYQTFTLDSTGLGWIAKNGEASQCSATNGVSCFGLREGHDITDVAIVTPSNPDLCDSSSSRNSITISTSEETGTSQDPYLSVTYTLPATAVQTKLSLKGGGALKVLGGKLRILPHLE